MCLPENGLPVKCTFLANCPTLFHLLEWKKREVEVFLREKSCGFEGFEPKVICPSNFIIFLNFFLNFFNSSNFFYIFYIFLIQVIFFNCPSNFFLNSDLLSQTIRSGRISATSTNFTETTAFFQCSNESSTRTRKSAHCTVSNGRQ